MAKEDEKIKCVYCGRTVIDSTVTNVCQDCILDPVGTVLMTENDYEDSWYFEAGNARDEELH